MCRANGMLPRSRFRVSRVADLRHLDTHFGHHLEPIVRQIVFETRDEIAERIDVFAARARFRIERYRSRMTGLIGQVAGRQMQ